jgi:serine protease Do
MRHCLRRFLCLAPVLSGLLLIGSSLAWAKETPPTVPSLAPILEKAMPAVVNIAVQGILPPGYSAPGQYEEEDEEDYQDNYNEPPGFNSRRNFETLGSGVVLNAKEGLIITNDHVIQHAKTITVTLNDGRRIKAELVGTDSETDIALLKIDASKLQNITIGDSDHLRVGDFVVAIGNPFGLNSLGTSQTATFGIVSALQRSDLNIKQIENFIQTDAAINPGNSGGAMVNMKGELVGINTAIFSPYAANVGIGFAIPINMVNAVVDQLITHGSVYRGLMGIIAQPLTPELAEAFGLPDTQGAVITQVNQGSPAEKAGLHPGDIIVEINGTKITQAAQVKNTIKLLRVGSKVRLEIMREGKPMTIVAGVSDIKEHEKQIQERNPLLFGFAMRDFDQQSPIHGRVKGVQIIGEVADGPGWRAGLRPGDVIVEVNKQPIENMQDMTTIVKKNNNKQLLVRILRGSGSLYFIIK